MALVSPTPINDPSLPLPDRADRATFADRMEEQFRWQREDLASGAEMLAQQAYENAAEAVSAATGALAAANYKGSWSTLVGALAIPASVHHSGTFWALLQSVPDVAAVTPGVSPVWAQIGGVSKSGDTMIGPLNVPSGAAGTQVPQAQEVIGRTSSTGSAKLPYGTSAQRDGSPSNGFARVNSDFDALEHRGPNGWKQYGIVSSAVFDANTGTSHEITNIPTWAKRVTLHMIDVSTNGSNNLLAQAGTSVGLVTSGYEGTCLEVLTSGNFASSSAAGVPIARATAADAATGAIEFVRQPGTGIWKITGFTRRGAGGAVSISVGTVTLADDLTRIAIVRTSSDSFDGSGKIWATWEG